MSTPSWIIAEPSLPALTYTYSFGQGRANALALIVDGGVVVVSPPSTPTPALFAELEHRGPVRALVAPNAFHHLGLAPWKARHQDAPIFAPAQSIARLESKSGLRGIRPVTEAANLLGSKVEILDMPHYRTGEILVRWRVEGGFAWYVTDVIMNFPRLPPGPFGVVFKLTRSGPGLRRNAIAGLFMVKDKRALYRWLAEQADRTPPKLVLVSHGEHAHLGDPGGEMRACLR